MTVVQKYCTGCSQMRNPDEGSKEKRGKATRWICNVCKSRLSKSIYQSKAKNNVLAT
jgi:hypothetical protein